MRMWMILLLLQLAGCAAGPTRLALRSVGGAGAGASDRVTMRYTDEVGVVEVTHGRGIGGAELVRVAGDWPGQVVVRLAGFERVEGFDLTGWDARGRVVMQADLGRGLETTPLPFGGGYQVVLPESVLSGRATRLRVQWVDYYRR